MKRFFAALLFGVFFLSGMALAVPRYLVEDSSNVIKAYTEDDSLIAPPGHTAVDASVIQAAYSGTIYQGGTWDGTTYTPPTGIVVPLDTSTAQGMVKESCLAMLDEFEQALDYIHHNRSVWPDASIAIAVEGIRWQIINSARVALNATRTAARRQKFCEESASWPDGTDGHVGGYLDAISANDSLTTPTKDWSWVDPQADPYTRPTVANSTMQFGSATNVENAPSSEKLIGREWIFDIP